MRLALTAHQRGGVTRDETLEHEVETVLRDVETHFALQML